MHDGLLETGEALEGTLELLGTALHQHLYGHIIRDHLPLDQLTQEVILDLGCCRKAHLDFLEAQLYKHLEKLDLLLYAHRIHQCLVTITQIDGAPDRCFRDFLIHPGSFRISERRKTSVTLVI